MDNLNKRETLPKLPKGLGRYDYQQNGSIRYRRNLAIGEKTVEFSATGHTLSEVNEKMKQKISEYISNYQAFVGADFQMPQAIQTPNQYKTLEDAVREWMLLYKYDVEDVKITSFDRLYSTFECHIENTSLGKKKIGKITSDMIQAHIKGLKNKKTDEPLSYSSKKKVYDLLNAFFRYFYVKEPQLNPMNTVLKPKKKIVQKDTEELIVWNDEEMNALCKLAYEPYIPGKSGFKNGLGIIFLMWCFLRENEAIPLTYDDIDFEKGIITIKKAFIRVDNRDKDTGERLEGAYREMSLPKYDSVRLFKLPLPALNAVKEMRKRNPKALYIYDNGNGEPMSEYTLYHSYKMMCKRAGLPENKNVTLHGLRHTGISYYLRHGVPVEVISKMAGHKSIQITLDTYYSVLEEQKDNAIDVFNKKYAEE